MATDISSRTCRPTRSPSSKTACRSPSRSSRTNGCRSASGCSWTSATACSASASATRARRSSGSCSNRSSQDDALFVMTFNHEPRLLTPWTTPAEAAAVRSGLDTLRSLGRHGDLRRRAHRAAGDRSPAARSRGAGRSSRTAPTRPATPALRDLRSALLRTDAFIYAVAIDSPIRQAINTRVNAEALGEITNQSGGRTEVVHDGPSSPPRPPASPKSSTRNTCWATPRPTLLTENFTAFG